MVLPALTRAVLGVSATGPVAGGLFARLQARGITLTALQGVAMGRSAPVLVLVGAAAAGAVVAVGMKLAVLALIRAATSIFKLTSRESHEPVASDL
jgi:hypothetical protein